ncbi:MAG: PH domain-containing protein [Candidatus Bathyarchaeia archaeon]
MSFDIPKGVQDILAASERIHRVLKTWSIVNKPEYTILTDRRILYFDEKFLGRYDLADIPFSKLVEVKAERGRVRFGSIAFSSEELKKPIKLKKVPKGDIEPFIDALEIALNNVAVAPISIIRSKGLIGKMRWEFKKTPEMLFKSRPADGSSLERRDFFREEGNKEALQQLKMRFVKGEITEEEYLRMRDLLY